MNNTLQKKFVKTAMAAITILIIALLGFINIFNIVIVNKEIERKLNTLSRSGIDMSDPKHYKATDMISSEFTIPNGQNNQRRQEIDAPMNEKFFAVRFDEAGNIIHIDISRMYNISEDEAVNIAKKIYESEKQSGKTENFRYAVNSDPQGSKTIVCMDTSDDSVSYTRVLVLSVAAGVLCWAVMLLIVVLLSRHAIRPIAENIEKQKQFITNAGHEIKTPLAIIQSNTEAMELYNGENKWSKNIKEQTVRLGGLMNYMLALARMDEGAMQIKKTNFMLNELVEKSLQSFMQTAEQRTLKIISDIADNANIVADEEQTETAINILIENAVKYADEGSEMIVSLKKHDKKTKLIVQNKCRDLPEVTPEKLFDRFYRGDTSRNQKSGGYGLGLSIARTFTEANGGKLYAEYVDKDSIKFTMKF